MGFDFYISLHFEFNLDTGFPIIPRTHDGGHYYRIPEKWLDFIDMSHSHMRYYTEHLDGNSCSMETFYDYFPDWDSIKEKIKDFTDDWTEETHNEFEAFVEWCAERGYYQANYGAC
jgi:hypothetical protein